MNIGVVCLLLWVVNPVTVFLHELGHALPLLYKTKGEVQIFLGSYGDTAKSSRFKVGRLVIWFKYNPISWECGLCVPNKEDLSVNDQILYVLAGPVFSVLIAIPAVWVVFATQSSLLAESLAVTFLISAVVDLLRNLTPNPNEIVLEDGTVIYNDGQQLCNLWRYKKVEKGWELAFEQYYNKQYEKSAAFFLKCIEWRYANEAVYGYAISSLVLGQKFAEAVQLYEKYQEHVELSSFNCLTIGHAYGRLQQYEKALLFFEKAQSLEPESESVCNNVGYTLNLLERYEEAIIHFDKAVQLDAGHAYAYNNRGLAKIKLGRLEEGLGDIERSMELDQDNSYAYRNLGIYHLDIGQTTKALELFQKAKDLDPTTHLIDQYLHTAISTR